MGGVWVHIKGSICHIKELPEFQARGEGGHFAERPGENTGPPRDWLGPCTKGQSYFGIGLSIFPDLYVPALLDNIILLQYK